MTSYLTILPAKLNPLLIKAVKVPVPTVPAQTVPALTPLVPMAATAKWTVVTTIGPLTTRNV